MLIIGGCKGEAEKIVCLNNIITKNQSTIEYQKISEDICDSISEWAKNGLKNTSGFLGENSIWKFDAFLFNEDNSKIFGWLLMIDKDDVSDLSAQSERDDILDYVIYFSGEKINGEWYYYIHNMPKIWFARKENNNKPYSFNKLSNSAKKETIKGGILRKNSCTINFDYINDWIVRDGRKMQEWHKLFLQSSKD